MRLSPKEIEKLLLHQAGFVAQKRYARGVKLNYPESIALISTQLLELIREGYAVAQLMDLGKQILGFEDVMTGVSDMIDEIQIEGTFPDGTKLVTIHHPICRLKIDNELALYGSGLTKNGNKINIDNIINERPGEKIIGNGFITLNEGRETKSLVVVNSGDRPVQVGSHYPFAETNKALTFDRKASLDCRLNIPAGTAVRFEPGEEKEVELVTLAGEKKVFGGNGLINGQLSDQTKHAAIQKMKDQGYLKD